ncbi:MAG: bifunctional phosphoglucose/phosphomannose isomerase [Dehalococcoidia bacterium]|nr:bifunctional phosphoglucose/phosphomannose isomerase [Dehalococcoidia bacterium]
MKQTDLDNIAIYSLLDPSDMLRHLHDIPQLCLHAWEKAEQVSLPDDYRQIKKVVILGMGGSAIGGDLLSSLIADECPVPIITTREYTVPAFVDEQTLVIASSYSGTTEETLSSFEPLLNHACRKIVMASGGKLAQMAKEFGFPLYILDYQSPPRAALPVSFITLANIFCQLGFLDEKQLNLTEACQILHQEERLIDISVPEKDNVAKQIANKLYGKLSIIYGAEHLSVVAGRWRLQINENAKAWAFSAIFPELNHNATTGYEVPNGISQSTHVVMLRGHNLHPRVKIRYDITGRILEKAGVQYSIIDAKGHSKLAQMLSAIILGDYTSYYLALLYGIDPYPIKAVEDLKAELANNNRPLA